MEPVTGIEAQRWPLLSEDDFVTFYDATVHDAYRYASRLAGNDRARTEDLVQDVYLNLLRQTRTGSVETVGTGWVIVAIRHKFLDNIRTQTREQRHLELVQPTATTIEQPEPATVFDTTTLSDRERSALTLRYIDDLPVYEVANLMGATVRATESLLARARTRMRAESPDA
jgi:RNA polymerase sigma-70 factor, ECF subfamily